MITAVKYLSKFTLLCFSIVIAINTYAALPGIYLGGQMGWGNVSDSGISRQDMGDLITATLNDNNFTIRSFNGTTSGNGLAGRIFTGYQFGCNWAMEFGWTKYNSLPVKATANAIDHDTTDTALVSTGGTFKVDAFDLVGKGIFPLPYHFSAYGKLGLAYLQGRSNASARVSEPGFVESSGNVTDVTGRYFPIFGLGVAYDFRPDIQTDLSWTRIQKIGQSDELGSADFVSLGLILHFDKWCVFC